MAVASSTPLGRGRYDFRRPIVRGGASDSWGTSSVAWNGADEAQWRLMASTALPSMPARESNARTANGRAFAVRPKARGLQQTTKISMTWWVSALSADDATRAEVAANAHGGWVHNSARSGLGVADQHLAQLTLMVEQSDRIRYTPPDPSELQTVSKVAAPALPAREASVLSVLWEEEVTVLNDVGDLSVTAIVEVGQWTGTTWQSTPWTRGTSDVSGFASVGSGTIYDAFLYLWSPGGLVFAVQDAEDGGLRINLDTALASTEVLLIDVSTSRWRRVAVSGLPTTLPTDPGVLRNTGVSPSSSSTEELSEYGWSVAGVEYLPGPRFALQPLFVSTSQMSAALGDNPSIGSTYYPVRSFARTSSSPTSQHAHWQARFRPAFQ